MPEAGFNYRASDIHCALGLSQLSKLNAFVERRRSLAAHYDEAIKPLNPIIRPLARTENCDPAWHLYPVRIDFAALGRDRGAVMNWLKAKGIGTQVHYIPVHTQPYYRGRYGEIALPGAQAYYESTLSIPLFPSMSDSDADRVVEALSELVQEASGT